MIANKLISHSLKHSFPGRYKGKKTYFGKSFGNILSFIVKRPDVGTHFEAPRGEKHSEKPNEIYDLIETCSYAPYIELFSRHNRVGWTMWGADIPGNIFETKSEFSSDQSK